MPGPEEIRTDSGLLDEVPQTPITPVSAEAFMSLHNMIQQDTSTLDETSTLRLQRRIQKLANAGQKAIAYCALLDHEKQLLKKINSEAKVRRPTKLIVLGKGQGKVMSFEDIVAAQAARVARDVVKGKGKRGRKRTSVLPDEGKPESDPEPNPELEPEPESDPEPGLEKEPEPEMVRAAKKSQKEQRETCSEANEYCRGRPARTNARGRASTRLRIDSGRPPRNMEGTRCADVLKFRLWRTAPYIVARGVGSYSR
jgi:hypothetical protein